MSSLSQRLNQDVVSHTSKTLAIRNAETSGTLSTESPATVQIELPQSQEINFSEGYVTADLKLTIATDGASDSLKPGSMSLFKSGRILVGGVPYENVSNIHVLSRALIETDTDNSGEVHGNWAFGYSGGAVSDAAYVDTFAQVAIKAPFGILGYDGLVPLHSLPPVVIELEMNSSAEACLFGTFAAGDKAEIQNIRYHASLYETTQTHREQTRAQINSPDGLRIPMTSWSSTSVVASNATEQEFNISSSARSAKSVLLVQRAAANINDGDADMAFVRDNLDTLQLTVGSDSYPNAPMKSSSEAYLEMMKARGHSITSPLMGNISRDEYYVSGGKAVYGFNLEKMVSDQATTGSDLGKNPLRLKLTYSSAPTASNQIFAFVERDSQLVIKPNGNVSFVV